MTSISSTSSHTKPPPPVSPAVAAANKTLNMLINSSDMTQALAAQSSKYLPATSKQILSTVWAMFDLTGSHTVNKAGVQAAVIAEGGKPSDANALWAQLDPTGKTSINAEDFITNKYLLQAVASGLKTVQAAVATYQQQQGPAQGSEVLNGFITLGGNGSLISDVGEGTGDLGIFV